MTTKPSAIDIVTADGRRVRMYPEGHADWTHCVLLVIDGCPPVRLTALQAEDLGRTMKKAAKCRLDAHRTVP